MAEKLNNHIQLAEGRRDIYKKLFQGELPYEPTPPGLLLGVAALNRATFTGAPPQPRLRTTLEVLPYIIGFMLDTQQYAADERLPRNEAGALLYVTDPTTLAMLKEDLVAVWREWETALFRREELSILGPTAERFGRGLLRIEDEEEAYAMVLETASATLDAYSVIGQSKLQRETVVKLIRSWGSQFVRAWMDKSILRHELELQYDLPALRAARDEYQTDSPAYQEKQSEIAKAEAELEEVLNIFLPGQLKAFARRYITDPLRPVRKVKSYLETSLSVPHIAQELEWGEKATAEIFTLARRTYLAIGQGDPHAAILKIKYNLEHILTISNIAKELGWTAEEVEDIFTPDLINRIAITRNITDPLVSIRKIKRNFKILTPANIAERLEWPVRDVKEVFAPWLIRVVAVDDTADPLNRISLIGKRLKTTVSVSNMARELDWPEAKVAYVFSDVFRVLLALGHKAPMRAAKRWIAGEWQTTLTIEEATRKRLHQWENISNKEAEI